VKLEKIELKALVWESQKGVINIGNIKRKKLLRKLELGNGQKSSVKKTKAVKIEDNGIWLFENIYK
jgi:hypothetical protein